MPKVTAAKINKSEENAIEQKLFKTISSLKNPRQIEIIFKDLFTPSELVMITRRIQIAKMLLKAESYETIRANLGVGYDTIKSVRRQLDAGYGGYDKLIENF